MRSSTASSAYRPMRFLGNIATPKLDASPIETIKSLWGGELLEFDNRAAVKPDPGNLIRLCQTRTE